MRLSIAALSLTLTLPSAVIAQQADRMVVEDFWKSKGVPAYVAAGIADNVQRESNFDPTAIGDGGSSLGMFQHHARRMDKLLARIENDQAFSELMGEDPVSAAHFNELKNAKSREESARIWQKYFERPKGTITSRAPRAAKANLQVAQESKPTVTVSGVGLDPFSGEAGDGGSSFLITEQH